MLRHELSSHKVRLLLSVLMLKDACRNHHAIPSVDPVVSDEPRYFADEGYKALIDQLPRLLGVGNTVTYPTKYKRLRAAFPRSTLGRRHPTSRSNEDLAMGDKLPYPFIRNADLVVQADCASACSCCRVCS
jgi:hypothetical protein